MIKLQASNRTLCRIYHKRLGTVIKTVNGQTYYCNPRENTTFNFKGCPYNHLYPDRPLIDIKKNEVIKLDKE